MINKFKIIFAICSILCLTGTVWAQSPAKQDIHGSWIFEKAYVYGDWWEDDAKWQHMTPEELAETMQDIYLEIDDYFYVSNVCESGYVRISEPTAKFFSDRLGPDVDLQKIKVWFKGAFGVELGNAVELVLLDWDPAPYHYWLVFPDKLILAAYDDYFASFTPTDTIFTHSQPDSFGGLCSQRPIEMGEVITCTYANKNLSEAYALVMEKFPDNAKHLKDVLPETDLMYESNADDEHVYMEYAYTSYGNLVIFMGYPGGVTTFSLLPLGNDVEVKTIYSAD